MNIYICGNPLVKEDSLPLKLLPKLKGSHQNITFKEFDPTENLPEEKHFIIIDTILNTKTIKIIHDIDNFQSPNALGLHDADLAFTLKLAKKADRLNRLTIIGLPPDIDEKRALDDLEEILHHLKNTSKE